MRRLLRHRDARLLLTGEFFSMFGDRAMLLVLGIWVKSLTGSSAAAGLVFFVLGLPALAAPLAGLVVDRVRRRVLMIWVDLFMAAAVLSLLFVRGEGQIWLIYVVAALYGASFSVFGSAQSALLTVMLPDELLADANSAFQTVREGLRLIAPLAGAALFAAFGGGVVAVVDAATFAVSAIALAALRVRETKRAPVKDRPSFVAEAAAGIRHIRRTRPLRQIVLTVAALLLVVGFAETLIFAVVDQGLHRSPSFVGVLGAAQGVGAVIGGLTAAAMLRRVGDGALVALGIGFFVLGDVGLAVPNVAVVLLGVAVAGLGISWIVVGFYTSIQRRTPADIQGRVYSAADMVVSAPQTVSIALGAALSTVLDFRVLVAIMAGVSAVCGAYLLTRRIPPLPSGTAERVPGTDEALAVGGIPPTPPA
jgi:MFS family permease